MTRPFYYMNSKLKLFRDCAQIWLRSQPSVDPPDQVQHHFALAIHPLDSSSSFGHSPLRYRVHVPDSLVQGLCVLQVAAEMTLWNKIDHFARSPSIFQNVKKKWPNYVLGFLSREPSLSLSVQMLSSTTDSSHSGTSLLFLLGHLKEKIPSFSFNFKRALVARNHLLYRSDLHTFCQALLTRLFLCRRINTKKPY